MNERIRELAEQAGATINEGFDGKKDFVYGITMSPEELEKFAELIVRECADYIDAFNEEHMVEEGTIGADIKEHFGVEE